MNKNELLTRTLDELNKRYPQGLYEYLFKYRPELYKQLIELEDRIDQTYLNPIITIDQLKVFLREYWTFHMKSTKDFKKAETNLDLNIPKIREKMTEERERVSPRVEIA